MESTDRWSEHYAAAAAASYYGSAENYYRHHQQMYHNYPFATTYDVTQNNANNSHNLSSPPQWTRNNAAQVAAYPTPNGSIYSSVQETSPASLINPKLASSPLQINGNYSNIPYAYHQTYHGMHNFTSSSSTSCYNPLTPPKDIGNKSTGETNSDSSTTENSFKNPKIESTEEEFDEDSSSNDLGDENWTQMSDNHLNDDANTKTLGLKSISSTSKKTSPG